MMGKAVMSDLNIEDKIKKMRARLSGDADEDSSDAGGGNRQLEARMDVIEGKLDQVLELLTAKAPSNGIPVKKSISARGPVYKVCVVCG